MIIDFTISNFGPFKDPVTLTFEASKDKHLVSSYVREFSFANGKTMKLLRMALLYGANAAGKTTILEALSLLDGLVTTPTNDVEAELDVNPFEFQDEVNPTRLSIKFIRLGIVYRYQLDLTKSGIICETLEYQAVPPDGIKFNLIYQRCRGDLQSQFIFNFGTKFKLNKSETQKIHVELLPNITMLSVLNRKMTIQNEMVQQAYLWFKEQLLGEVTPNTNLTNWVSRELDNKQFDRSVLLKTLNQAGIPIQSLELMDRTLTSWEQDILQNAPDEETRDRFSKLFENRPKEVNTVYQIGQNSYRLSLERQESLGTQRYYGLAGLLSALCQEGIETDVNSKKTCKVLPIDEIEHSLHPDLLEHFIVTFLSDSSQSQLIATTHYREFLQNILLFRDDVIWFVDKDDQTLSSGLYCLEDVKTDAGLRATSSVYNFYKHGRLGAVPKFEV